MQELLDKLGINLPVLIAQLINFIILFGILMLVAYKPIRRQLDERSNRIKESMEQAELVRQQSAQAEERIKAQLDGARQEAQKVLAQAEGLGDRLKEEARAEAQKEAQGLLARAQEEIRLEREQSKAELRKEVVDIAILAAEKVIKQSLDQQAHRRLVQEAVNESSRLKEG